MLEGVITKGVGGFYYVKTDRGVYECRARGAFREKNITPLVGDRVLIRESDSNKTGYVEEIFERKTQLKRPPVANVSQAVIVASIKNPDPNLWLLDRFLVLAEGVGINIVIVINKVDLVDTNTIDSICKTYEKARYKVILTSSMTDEGIDELKEVLKDNVTVFAGPSGVGKSSLLNKIQKKLELKTGEISNKTKRGKHTTRHTELLELEFGGYVLDTPGFSSLNLDFIEKEEDLKYYFKEIEEYSTQCKFSSCLHISEPGCQVREKVESGEIGKTRYENYLSFINEIKSNRRY
ncbi:ribosome small subunit-dependent GTPase A [Anaerosalibacter sp. Marseille-P3206]|uniref:ribosome small subunit-dependent GTPase A n=1 Tax=Anaerosalibacter sp. Marseille-P3206 TaxID=1871005 RepID=UPI000985C4DD|nr:ribosome small subunit-dependent GTPase A [Anaerosalibacter sp. Marseille-P3206]